MHVLLWLLAGVGVFSVNLLLGRARGRRRSAAAWALSLLMALALGPIPVVVIGAVVTLGIPGALLLGFLRATAR